MAEQLKPISDLERLERSYITGSQSYDLVKHIPEDLRESYKRALVLASNGGYLQSEGTVTALLIERIARLEAEKLEAANQMLDSIRASLKEWPIMGCDIEVARQVVRIRDEAITKLEAENARLKAPVSTMDERISSLISATCERCARGDRLFLEPETGFYTHTFGENYCSAHKIHNLLNTEASQAARAQEPPHAATSEMECK